MKVRYCQDDDHANWDAFLQKSSHATFQHSWQFLSYHGPRFTDRSVIVEDESANILAVFPAAESLQDKSEIVSHPGATYGGIITHKLRGEALISAFDLIKDFYTQHGYQKLIYKPVPAIYQRQIFQDDRYALFRHHARLIRSDLNAVIDLSAPFKRNERRKRALKKALKSDLTIKEGADYLSYLWPVLEDNLKSVHRAKPVHSLAEIQDLAQRFPDHITAICAYLNHECVAGIVRFRINGCDHAQYICSVDAARDINALDLVFDFAIDNAQNNQQRYFAFGTSNEAGGTILNDSLYRFKHEFGAGSITHDFFELDLT